LAMTGGASAGGLKAGAAAATGLDRLGTQCREVSRGICNVFVRKTGRLCAHCWVLAHAIAIATQSRYQVRLFLAAKLGHTIGRVSVPVAINAVAAKTGIGEDCATLGVAREASAVRKNSAGENKGAEAKGNFLFANHLIVLRILKSRRCSVALEGRYGSDIGASMPVPSAGLPYLFGAVTGDCRAIELPAGWSDVAADVFYVRTARMKRTARRRIED